MEVNLVDKNIVVKALTRRGLALEHLEKYKDAKEDMQKVKTLQPSNKQASESLTRINKALASMKNEGRADKIYELKDQGNALFKTNKEKAAQKFGEAIKVYREDPEELARDKNLKLIITQCFTNRSICYHNLNRQIEALSDADFVIKNLDSANVKAHYRRGYAHMTIENFEDSLKDFQKVKELDPKNKDIEKDIRECMQRFDKKRLEKSKSQQQTSKPKVKEVKEVKKQE